jgi:methylenetetrahydrofolate reductase (NADPH)
MSLQSLLESRTRPVLTAELAPVDGGGLDKVHQHLESVAPYVDAINATDNPAAHAHASNVAIAIAMVQAGAEPIMQVVCRDKNRLAIQADIVGASMHGVRNICALTGDDVTAGDEPEARRVFDLDGPQVIAVAQGLADGHYVSGRKIDPAPDLFIGAVENPFAPPVPYRVERAKIKSDAGARFLQTQIGYQPQLLEQFVSGCIDNGVAEKTGLLVTVVLVKRAGAMRFMDREVPGISVPADVIDRVANASDEGEAAYQHVLEQCQHALSLPGVAGLHVTDFRHDGSLGRLVEELGLARHTVQQDAS